ncbi:MAG TPA: hypothetical protein VN541_09205 [Tepidisphaeraceae bacterium]|nr:hypothetical protein [Tepidisphaeraceae bacterium]
MNSFANQVSFLVITAFFEPLMPTIDRIKALLKIPATAKWRLDRAPLDLTRPGFSQPKRGGALPISVSVWSPASRPELTAFCAHSEDGWGHFVGKISAANGPESISVRSTATDEPWGLQEVSYRKPGSYWPARIVQWLQEEDGYKFLDEGEPFGFENDLNPDPRKRIATRADVLRFVNRFGIDLDNKNFWKSDVEAIYLQEVRDNISPSK